MYYEVRIRSGPRAGQKWRYDDEEDARAALALLGDEDAAIIRWGWFGGAWVQTQVG